MTDPRIDDFNERRARPRVEPDEARPQYPENRMLAIIGSRDQLHAAIQALTSGGFLGSEIEVLHGAAAAKTLQEETGRGGFANLVMRFVQAIGLPNDEAALKAHYADALDDGRFVISLAVSSEERKAVAAKLLRDHGGADVRYFSRFTITTPLRAD